MSNASLRIVQISDIHFFMDENKALLGVKTQESFQAVFELVKKESFDFILLTGDLSQDGSAATYIRLADILDELNVPIYYIPGNHDNSDVMKQVYPKGHMNSRRHIVFDHWQLILLDSHIPGAVEGLLDQSQMRFLEDCLQAYPQHRAVIVFHHQPVAVGCQWLDNLGLKNADTFWECLSRYPNAHTVLFGHVHQVHEGAKKGIKYYSTPSTCFQFKVNSDTFAIENLPPGYRYIELYPNGTIETRVCRVPHYVGVFDETATGY